MKVGIVSSLLLAWISSAFPVEGAPPRFPTPNLNLKWNYQPRHGVVDKVPEETILNEPKLIQENEDNVQIKIEESQEDSRTITEEGTKQGLQSVLETDVATSMVGTEEQPTVNRPLRPRGLSKEEQLRRTLRYFGFDLGKATFNQISEHIATDLQYFLHKQDKNMEELNEVIELRKDRSFICLHESQINAAFTSAHKLHTRNL